jgi:hypothetical protein
MREKVKLTMMEGEGGPLLLLLLLLPKQERRARRAEEKDIFMSTRGAEEKDIFDVGSRRGRKKEKRRWFCRRIPRSRD